MDIKKDDNVQVIAGKDKGKTGKVLRVDRTRNRLVVEGVNIVKRHKKATPVNPEAGIIEREGAIHASNVLLYSEKLQKGVRVSYRFVGNGGEFHATQKAALESFGAQPPAKIKKVRICTKTGEEF